MLTPRHMITPKTIADATHIAAERINHVIAQADEVSRDPQQAARLTEALCRCCFYLRKSLIAGARVTSRPCASCEQIMTFGSTATDVLCPSCATRQGLCKKCGGSVNI